MPRIARPSLAGMILTASTICPGTTALQAASLQTVSLQSVTPQMAWLQTTSPRPDLLQTGSDPHGPAARSQPRATAAAAMASPALARQPSGPQQGRLAQGPAAPASQSSAATAAGAGLVTIESDRQQADNSSGVITASGNVRITYPERRLVATARQAQYFSREGRLVLSGDVDVIDADGQRIRAERLVYRLDSGRLLASPAQGQQVYSRLRLQSGSGSPAPTLLP
ncbi:MAG: hypothetical protein VKJ44_05625 [Synechococcus sp.]|nr:hypothetical protein [Synechococcus sp.]